MLVSNLLCPRKYQFRKDKEGGHVILASSRVAIDPVASSACYSRQQIRPDFAIRQQSHCRLRRFPARTGFTRRSARVDCRFNGLINNTAWSSLFPQLIVA